MSKQSKRHMGAKIKSTEGVDAITVADDGKVGIGTDSPGSKLDVAVTGVNAAGAVGTVFVWGDINDNQNPNWQNIAGAQAPTWGNVSTGQTPNWQDIAA